MRIVYWTFIVMLGAGCASFKKQSSRTDPYDAVKVDQVVGNNVSSAPFQRTIVCLNARRETRQVTLVTNVQVSFVTNALVVTLTNQTVTVVSNANRTFATNLVAAPPPTATVSTNEAGVVETNLVAVPAATPPNSTNETVTTANNLSHSKAGNQISSLTGFQTQLNRQITVSTNNVSITTADNHTLSAETNLVLMTQTNVNVTPVTNVTVVETNLLLRDYYLFTEVTPPPDFVMQQGESLVLLVDGVRHGFAPTASSTVFISRKGYNSTLYRVPPEVLVDITNAKEVRLRIKGVNSVIERTMNTSSRKAFRKFLVKYFQPEPAGQTPTAGNQAALTSQPES